MATGPDTFMRATAGELTSDDFEELAEVWPAAFVAAGKLVVQVSDGEVPEDSPKLDMNLFDLVRAYKRGDLDV